LRLILQSGAGATVRLTEERPKGIFRGGMATTEIGVRDFTARCY
jgi:hypothetical protein